MEGFASPLDMRLTLLRIGEIKTKERMEKMPNPEEIRLAVLKECAAKCPQFGDKYEDGIIELYQSFQGNPGYLLALGGKLWRLMIDAKDNVDSPIWQLAYRLLNIEGRELEERYNDLLKLSNQIQEKADTLEERVQGLVDALEEIANPSNQAEVDSAHIYAAAALDRWKGGGNG